jgi:DNA repair protein SbcC/Rad50
VRLVRLEIQTLPGIEPGFVLENIAPGVNLVTGPNAIGKSSLVRALRYLLAAPAIDDSRAVALNAVLEDGGHWTVRRTGSQQAWERNGQPVEPPPLPDADSLHCYWLSMENLLAAEAGDERLVAELRRALAGGFDLRALREDDDFAPRPRVGQSEGRELHAAEAGLREAEAHYRALRRDESELPDLERGIKAARDAAERVERLGRAMKLLEILRARGEIDAGLASFPEGMERLRGDELERLARLDQRRGELRAALETVARRREETQAALTKTGLAAARPDESQLQSHEQKLSAARRLQEQLAYRRRELEQAQAAESSARESLGGGGTPPRLTPESITRAEKMAAGLNSRQIARDELSGRIVEADLGPADNSAAAPKLASLLAALGGLVAIVFGTLAQAWLAVIGGILALAGAARAAWAGRAGSGPSPADRRRLERLERELATLEAERAQLAQELGFDPKLTAVGIDHFVRYSEAWRLASEQRDGLESTVARLEREIAEAAAAVRGFLGRWGIDVAVDLERLSAALQALETRCRAAEDAERGLEALERESTRLEGELAALDEDEAGLFREAGLAPGGRDALQSRLGELDAWKAQRERLAEARRREAEARQALEGDAQLLGRAERGEHEELIEESDAARQEADQLESLQRRHTEIQTRLADAGADRRLERALAAADTARAALEDRRDEVLLAEAGQCLLDGIETEFRSEHRPAVLDDACARFRRFTHHAWDVELDEDADRLLARDLKQGAQRTLTELSSGTRMQLLLAVRLAWLRSLEQGHEVLPLFLDEALTTSDEARFAIVAESLQHLADDEGRQVFYLSARRHELALWTRAAGKRPHHIDLAQVRFGAAAAAPEVFHLPDSEPLPAPAGRSPEAYAAALGVPPVDPRRPEGGLHLFHLLRDDLGLLHRLMEDWHITSLGQLEALLASDAAAAAVPDAARRDALASRCAGARAWIAARRQGRGRPVDRIALERSDAVTVTFLDKVAELAAEVGGDATALLAGLRDGRVARFRSNAIGELESWLTEQGYIDPAEELDAAERTRHVLLTIGGRSAPEDARRLAAWLEAGTAA